MSREGRVLDLLEGYYRWLRLGYSDRTASTYKSIIERYIDYYGGVPGMLDPVEEAEVAIEFIEEYSGHGPSRRVAAYALKSLYNYLGRPDIASRIPSVRGTASWTPEVIPYGREVIRRLIEGLREPRDRAMMCVAYDLALRRSEVPLLKRTEFNGSTCEIVVYRLKGPKGEHRRELMQLSDWCCRLLVEYLSTRRDDEPWLFVSESRGRVHQVSRELVRRTFKKLARLLGREDLRFHQLRHTAITERAARTRDVIALAKYAGHRNPQSTMIYIHLSATAVKRRLEEGEPGGGDKGEADKGGGG